MKYASARAFRSALNDRLREQAGAGEDLARLQRQLAYERFLTRLFRLVGEAWVLKGGYALELRLGGRARATKDLDFNAPGGISSRCCRTQPNWIWPTTSALSSSPRNRAAGGAPGGWPEVSCALRSRGQSTLYYLSG